MDDSNLDGISSLVRLSGVSVPSRARYVGEALISSVMSSMTLGFTCGMAGSAFFSMGPLIPFTVGSWLGYSAGLFHHWQTSSKRAYDYARYYPTILAHSLDVERGIKVPPHVLRASMEQLQMESQNDMVEDTSNEVSSSIDDKVTFEDWIRQGGLGRLTWTILAAQSCRSDIEELQNQKRQRLMEEYNEKYGT